jgi:predicted kinase
VSGRRQWSEADVQRETLAALREVAKASRCTIKLTGLEVTTPPERAEALAKAFRYDQAASRMINQAEAAAYRDMAARERRKAGVS